MSLELDAARRRLAHALGCSPGDLAALEGIDDPQVLRAVERAVRRHLAAAEASRLTAVVAAARRLPTRLVATVAERQMGPELCAAAIGAVEPDHAVAIAGHLSVPFMVEVTLAADPTAAGHLAAALPRATTVAIAREVIARREHLVAAAFVGPIPPPLVAEVVAGVDDHAAVVRIALYVDDPSLLDPIVAELDDRYLAALLEVVGEEGLWAEGLNLVGHLGADQQARIGRLAAGFDDDTLAAVVETARAQGQWHGLLSLAGNLDVSLVARVAAFPQWAEEAVLEELVAVVDRAPRLAADLAGVVDHVDDATLDTLVRLVADREDLRPVVRIAAAVDDPARLGDIVDRLDDAALARVMGTVVEDGLWAEGLALLRRLAPDRRQRLLDLAGALPESAWPAIRREWAALADEDRAAVVEGLDDPGPLGLL